MSDDHDNRKTDEIPLVKGGQGRSDKDIERSLAIYLGLFLVGAVALGVWMGIEIYHAFWK